MGAAVENNSYFPFSIELGLQCSARAALSNWDAETGCGPRWFLWRTDEKQQESSILGVGWWNKCTLHKRIEICLKIDLVCRYWILDMQISNFRYAYSNMNLWGFLLTPAMYGQWTLCGVFCLKVALTYRSKNVWRHGDIHRFRDKKTKSPNLRTR